MDRNDRRHLPGFHEMIARGQMHSMYGGPDHIDASPLPQVPVMRPRSEPVGTVFGCIDAAPCQQKLSQVAAPHYPYRPAHDEMNKGFPFPVLDNVETDCAQTILDNGPATRGLTNMHVDPARARIANKQWKQWNEHSVDSGCYSGSLNSSSLLNSRDETDFVVPSPVPSITDDFRKLSLDKENVNDFQRRNRSERVSITSSDDDPSLGSNTSLKNDTEVVTNGAQIEPTVEEYTAKFQRNVKYFDQDPDLETNLHHLLYADCDELVLQFLDDLINYQFLDISNKRKQTILHVATIMNKPKVVQRIIARGATVDARDAKGNTPLHIASQKGYMQCVEVLTTPIDYDLVKNVPYQVPFRSIPQNMEFKNYEGLTCLHLAVQNNHFDIVHYLVNDMGADVNAVEGKRGMTALVMCAERRNAQMLMYLVQQCSANIHIRTYDRKNAIELAMGRGFPEVASLLKSIGAEAESPEEEEDDWIDEDFDDFTVNGMPVSMDE